MAAGFLHHTSRAGDPNLHIHSVIGNIACGPDGRWTALASKELYQHRYASEAVGQAVLRRELAHRLGWVFDPVDRHGVAEIAGFPPDLLRGFSKRRQVIETEMARRGVHSAKGARTVALATRAAKPDTVSEGVLRELWRHEADGFDVALLPRLRRPDPALVADHADLAPLPPRRAGSASQLRLPVMRRCCATRWRPVPHSAPSSASWSRGSQRRATGLMS